MSHQIWEAVGKENYNLNKFCHMEDAASFVYRVDEQEGMPPLVQEVLAEQGWKIFDPEWQDEDDWNLWWKGSRFRPIEYDRLLPWQRLNHYPKSNMLSKKDYLNRTMKCHRHVHGRACFNFWPQTYNLPNEHQKFIQDFSRKLEDEADTKQYWICKPSDLSRGRGIFVFSDIKDLTPFQTSAVIQKYITNPLLISGYKFDLRIYVVVTNFHPLTIFVHEQGLVRFSTDKYNLDNLENMYSHLTNTSINKLNPQFNEYVEGGTKWTLAHLRGYFHKNGIDDRMLWQQISKIINLTLLTQLSAIPRAGQCFELYGFDILIDDTLKPWLLEVNFSPMLQCDTMIDVQVKKAMIADILKLLHYKHKDKDRGFHYKLKYSKGLRPHSSHINSRTSNLSLSPTVRKLQTSSVLPSLVVSRKKSSTGRPARPSSAAASSSTLSLSQRIRHKNNIKTNKIAGKSHLLNGQHSDGEDSSPIISHATDSTGALLRSDELATDCDSIPTDSVTKRSLSSDNLDVASSSEPTADVHDDNKGPDAGPDSANHAVGKLELPDIHKRQHSVVHMNATGDQPGINGVAQSDEKQPPAPLEASTADTGDVDDLINSVFAPEQRIVQKEEPIVQIGESPPGKAEDTLSIYMNHPCFTLPKLDRNASGGEAVEKNGLPDVNMPPVQHCMSQKQAIKQQVLGSTNANNIPPPSASDPNARQSRQRGYLPGSTSSMRYAYTKQAPKKPVHHDPLNTTLKSQHYPFTKFGGFSLVFPFNDATVPSSSPNISQYVRMSVVEMQQLINDTRSKIKRSKPAQRHFIQTDELDESMLLWCPPVNTTVTSPRT